MSKILVVDDDPEQRLMMRRRFEVAGHVVDEAEDGAQAIDSVNAACPDLVVTDMMMPVMDGRELIRWLRTNPATAGVPILVVSGDPQLAENADRVLSKPYRLDELIAAVDSLLQESQVDTEPT